MKDLFEYNNDCNVRLLDLLLANPNQLTEKSISLINHLINSHEIWNARILYFPHAGVWDIRPLEQLPSIHQNNHFNTLEILSKIDLQQEVSYSNSKGETFSNTVKDILYHVINHSTYHRAQIASDLKLHNIAPINTDYIIQGDKKRRPKPSYYFFLIKILIGTPL